MMRLDSIGSRAHPRELHEVAQDPQADVARLLRMKLHAADVAALHDRRERLAVLGDRDGVAA